MNIVISTRLLLKDKLEGIGGFTHETLQRITRQHPEHNFYFLFDRPFDQSFIYSSNVKGVSLFPPTRHPVLLWYWLEVAVPSYLKKIKADLFVSTDGWMSLSTDVPMVQVCHDINFEHFPEFLPWVHRVSYKRYFPQYAQKAKRIATVSEFSKNDICTTYNVPPEKVDVVFNGASEKYKPITQTEIDKIRQEYTGGAPYFLFIGLIHKRKNLLNLLKAYEVFKKHNDSEIKLVIVGAVKWWNDESKDFYEQMHHKDDVVFTGWLHKDVLHHVLGGALALTYVPLFEGFGIPILEAMNTDVPVITSDVTSMPEVAGSAALYCDPYRPERIASAMQQLAKDPSHRQELIEKGRERRQLFSWDQTAGLFWETIEKSLNE